MFVSNTICQFKKDTHKVSGRHAGYRTCRQELKNAKLLRGALPEVVLLQMRICGEVDCREWYIPQQASCNTFVES